MEERALDPLWLVPVVRSLMPLAMVPESIAREGEIEMLVFMKNLAGVKFDRVAVEAASKDLASADAQMSKASLLRPTRPEQDDPNIADALAIAAGKLPAPLSLSERLVALKAG
jgi:hypothetical protein